jgi:hypothetical protein
VIESLSSSGGSCSAKARSFPDNDKLRSWGTPGNDADADADADAK